MELTLLSSSDPDWELNPGSDAVSLARSHQKASSSKLTDSAVRQTSAAEAEKATRDLHGDGARV